MRSRNGNVGYFLSVSVNTGTIWRDVKYKGKSDWSFVSWEMNDLCFTSDCLSATSRNEFCKWVIFRLLWEAGFNYWPLYTRGKNRGRHWLFVLCMSCIVFIKVIWINERKLLRITQHVEITVIVFPASLVKLQLSANKVHEFLFIYFNQLYMFRAMFPPIIRRISLLIRDSDNVQRCCCWLVLHNTTPSSSNWEYLWT